MKREFVFPGFKILLFKDIGDIDLEKNALMTTYHSANPYGDWVALATGLCYMVMQMPNEEEYRIVEVGTSSGENFGSMLNYMRDAHQNKKAFGWGIDSVLHGHKPKDVFFPENSKFIEGDSLDLRVIEQVPDECHFVFIDACHCWAHVYKDLVSYSPKVKIGGLLALHDTSPTFQNGTIQPPTPDCAKDTTAANVLRGIDEFGMENFELVLDEYSVDRYWGGVRIYQRIK